MNETARNGFADGLLMALRIYSFVVAAMQGRLISRRQINLAALFPELLARRRHAGVGKEDRPGGREGIIARS